MTETDTRLSLDERAEILARAIHRYIVQGWRVTSQTQTTAALVKGHRPNHILHLLLTLLTLGVWAIVWIIVAASNHEEHYFISVDEYGGLSDGTQVSHRVVTDAERTHILDQHIAKLQGMGWQVESRTDTDARFTQRKLFFITHHHYIRIDEHGVLRFSPPA